jgi:crotonobetainyl-CoA:carnitine CoA-transferase CaiB-like acyl-CoA transferase
VSAGLLSHLKVVELADDLGAYTGRLLAELGARVVKVEPPEGDPARRRGPTPSTGGESPDASIAWLATNAGKTGLTLDLTSAAGRQGLLDRLARADVLIQGGADRLAALDLPYATLARTNPGLISVIVAPFAEHGPMAGAAADDLTLMALSGILHMVGDPDRPPLNLPGRQAYALGGVQGVTAALTALYARGATGRGQRVWVSAYQSAVLAGYRDPIVWEWTGRLGQRTGDRLVRGKSGVRQIWAARDGYVTWSLVDNPAMVKGIVALMAADGAAGSLAEVDWDNILLADAPQERIDAWEAELAAWFRTRERDDLARLSAERGLGLSRIDTPEEALANPNWRSRGFWRTLEDSGRGLTLPLPGPLFRSSEVEPTDPTPAPRLEGGL